MLEKTTFCLSQSGLRKTAATKACKCCILLLLPVYITPLSTLFRGHSTQFLTSVIYRINLLLHSRYKLFIRPMVNAILTQWVRYFNSYLLHSKKTLSQLLHIFKLATCIERHFTLIYKVTLQESVSQLPIKALRTQSPLPRSCGLPVFKLSTLRGRPDWATATSFKAM